MDTDISVSLQEAAIAIRYLENADAPFTLANCYDLLASLSLDKEMVEVYLKAVMKDYIIDATTKEVVEGNKNTVL